MADIRYEITYGTLERIVAKASEAVGCLRAGTKDQKLLAEELKSTVVALIKETTGA